MIITASRALKRSLCNQTARVKTWVRSTEFHPIQQPPGLNRPMERRRSLPKHDTSAKSMRTGTSRSASWREKKSKDHRHYSQDQPVPTPLVNSDAAKAERGRKGYPVQDRTNPTITGSGRSHPPDLAGQGTATDASPLLLDLNESMRSKQKEDHPSSVARGTHYQEVYPRLLVPIFPGTLLNLLALIGCSLLPDQKDPNPV